ncbi:hypothetical protein MTR67_005530 [Solanum verrucosum]|uniref:Uncharacterized protein n=1 Tax=Solanum verrucosum TaxID=315347 RepID=A0AAF0TG40_SOLVR|nr:hypothetical protein MTR67_005530 [Solanum verrucosum]
MGVREATTASFRPPPLGGGHGRALTCLSTSLILFYRSSYIGIAGRLIGQVILSIRCVVFVIYNSSRYQITLF